MWFPRDSSVIPILGKAPQYSEGGGIEDSTAGYWRPKGQGKRNSNKRLSSPWFICSFYKQRPARPTSSQPNGNALGGQGVGVISPCKGKSPISRQCFCPFRAKKNINHESTGRCPGLRAVALSGRWNYELWTNLFTSLLTCCRLLKKQDKTNKNI